MIINRIFIVTSFLVTPFLAHAAAPAGGQTEKIVIFRHAEKNEDGPELGLLNCKGLNRALQLSTSLVKSFGKPKYLFAPNPSEKIEKKGVSNYYFRPLMTITPLAIAQNMPIDISFGYKDSAKLGDELLNSKYAGATIFVAWQSENIPKIAKHIYEKSKEDPSEIPPWEPQDYDSVFVIKIQRNKDTITAIEFTKDAVEVKKLSDKCPT